MALKLSLLPTDQKTDRAPELDLGRVKANLSALPFNDQPAESARVLADELARLNHWKVDPTLRWNLLEEYFSVAVGSWTMLDTLYSNVSHPMRPEVAAAADVAQAVANGVAMGYKRILADLSRMRLGFGLPKAPPLLLNA